MPSARSTLTNVAREEPWPRSRAARALTLTPALCATMLKAVPKGQHGAHGGAPRTGLLGLNDRFFQWFNHHFDRSSRRARLTPATHPPIAPTPTRTAMARHPSDSPDKDQPLIDDIRLLGRILGDVIREQEGVAAYELVEQVRKLSVAFRRDADQEADRALKKLLKSLSGDQTVSVIRAFTYFSHLANLAEDRHHIRRRAVHDRAGDLQEGSLAMTLQRLKKAGIAPSDVVRTLAAAHISPVLTAHPTEVQRKSILDAERAIAHLLAEREQLLPRDHADFEAQLRARVTQLWQTRLLRFTKLTVADEIENALSYYQATFLSEIPRIYRDLEEGLEDQDVAPFLRMGQWIGGDRDGNPNVTAQTLELALHSQADMVLRHHLTQLHLLGAELSVSAMLNSVSPAMQALAERSGMAYAGTTVAVGQATGLVVATGALWWGVYRLTRARRWLDGEPLRNEVAPAR